MSMQFSGRRGRAGRTAVIAAALAGLAGPVASAQVNLVDEEVIDELIVTGTRLRMAASQLPRQAIVYDADDLRNTGEPTLERALQRLPHNFGGINETAFAFESKQGGLMPGAAIKPSGAVNVTGASTVNLRGFTSDDTNATLILVDGKRLGTSGLQGGVQDVSGIPMAMVERVEIVLDGASAIYGADAIGGVVNIILKKDFDTVSAELRYDDSTDVLGGETMLVVTGGTGWGSGRLSGGVTTNHQAALSGDDLGIVALGTIPGSSFSFVPDDVPITAEDYVQNAAQPNVIIGDPADENFVYQTGGGGSPAATDFTPGVAPSDTWGRVGIIPKKEQQTVNLRLDQDLSDSVAAFARVAYLNRDVTYTRTTPTGGGLMAADDPRNPFGEAIDVRSLLTAFEPSMSFASNEHLTAQLGVDFRLGSRWNLATSVQWDDDTIESHETNWFDSGAAVSDGLLNPWDGGAHNDFAHTWTADDGNSVTGTYAEYLTRYDGDRSKTTNDSFDIDVVLRGRLFDIAGGGVQAQVGVEYRDESLESQVRIVPIGLSTYTSQRFEEMDTSLDRSAAFAELYLPFISDRNAVTGARQLSLSAAARREKAEVGGRTRVLNASEDETAADGHNYWSTTYSIGSVWAPVEDLRFKVNFNTSFATPAQTILFAPVSVTSPTNFFGRDNCLVFSSRFRPGGEYGCPVPFVNAGLPPTLWQWQDNPYFVLRGGNPELKPQRGETWSYTVEADVTDNLRVSANLHEVVYKDKQASLGDLLNALGPDAESTFPEAFTYWENGDIKNVLANAINIDAETSRGIDITIDYARDTDLGTIQFYSMLTRELERKEEFGNNSGLPAADLLGIKIPRQSGLVRMTWLNEGWMASVDSAYRGRLYPANYWDGTDNYPAQTGYVTKGYWLTNLRGGYTFHADSGMLANVEVGFGINNLFKTEPRTVFVYDGQYVGDLVASNPASNPRLQSFYVSVRKTF